MTTFAFDCAQFIVLSGPIRPNAITNVFELLQAVSSDLRFTRDVSQVKRDYLNHILEREVSDSVIEIVADEFQGVFEDWEEPQRLPPPLNALRESVAGLLADFSSVTVAFIKVSTMNPKRLFRTTLPVARFSEAVFSCSLNSSTIGSGSEAWVFEFTK